MSDLTLSMSPRDCRAAADYMEGELDKMKQLPHYPEIREQVERLADTVRILREEADEKEREG